MCIADNRKYEKIKDLLAGLQSKCQDIFTEMMNCVDKIIQSLSLCWESTLLQTEQAIALMRCSFQLKIEEFLRKVADTEHICLLISRLSAQQQSSCVLMLRKSVAVQTQFERSLLVAKQQLDEAYAKEIEHSKKYEELQEQLSDQEEVINELRQCLQDAKKAIETNEKQMEVIIRVLYYASFQCE